MFTKRITGTNYPAVAVVAVLVVVVAVAVVVVGAPS